MKPLLMVANVLHRGPHFVFKAGDDALDLIVSGANLARKDDALGGHQRLARNARERIFSQEGVNDGVGDPIGYFVRVPFGNAFRREDV
jgi:hypothetical protein